MIRSAPTHPALFRLQTECAAPTSSCAPLMSARFVILFVMSYDTQLLTKTSCFSCSSVRAAPQLGGRESEGGRVLGSVEYCSAAGGLNYASSHFLSALLVQMRMHSLSRTIRVRPIGAFLCPPRSNVCPFFCFGFAFLHTSVKFLCCLCSFLGAQSRRLLSGYKVWSTASVVPKQPELSNIVCSSGGEVCCTLHVHSHAPLPHISVASPCRC